MACYEYKGVKYTEGELIKLLQSQQPKTRRILEVQSDVFQKGRTNQLLTNTKDLEAAEKEGSITGKEAMQWADELSKTKENQFLQLLNKDNNWVTFFVKSIIQDSAKKGYEKVLFPSGNTASKVEGHTTLEEFKKQKEDRIKELEEKKKTASNNKPWLVSEVTGNKKHYFNTEEEANEFRRINGRENFYSASPTSSLKDSLKNVEDINNEIKQLKQELDRIEKEGFGALKPIYNFYENTVTNILKKQGYNPALITDEYGNTWNEVKIDEKSEEKIFLNINKSISPEKFFSSAIKPIIDRFSKLFPQIRTRVITEAQISTLPEEIQRQFRAIDKLNKKVISFYHNGNVYLIKERVTQDVAIEEYLHPFVNALEVENSSLYQSLLLEAKQLFPELKDSIFEEYKDVYDSILDLNREFLTQALSRMMSGAIDDEKAKSWWQKFKDWLLSLVERMIGSNPDIQSDIMDLPNMSAQELIKHLMQTGTTINLGDIPSATNFHLSEDQIKNLQDMPKTVSQEESLDSVIDNTNLFDFEAVGHTYSTLDDTGITVPYISVSQKIQVSKFSNIFLEFAEVGTAVHSLLNQLVNQGKPISKINLNEIAEKSDLNKFFGGNKEVSLAILDYIAKYVQALRDKGSIVLTEVTLGDRKAINQIEQNNRVAGTPDIIEILEDGTAIIHDFKNMLPMIADDADNISEKKMDEMYFGFDGQAASKIRQKYFEKQLSAYAKLLELTGIKVVDLQIVPIFIGREKGIQETEDSPISVEIASRNGKPVIQFPIQIDFNPFSNRHSFDKNQLQKYQVKYNKNFADKIIHTPVERPRVKTQLELEGETIENQLKNSENLSKGLEEIFEIIESTIKQYGNSEDEFKRHLFDKFQERSGDFSEDVIKLIRSNIIHIFKNKEKGIDVFRASVVQYLGFIQQISNSLENIRQNQLSLIGKEYEDDFDMLSEWGKLKLLAVSYRPILEEIKLNHLAEVEDSNLFKQMVGKGLDYIDQIERTYEDRTLPVLAKVLNAQFPQEYKDRVARELIDRKQKKQQLLDSLPADDNRRKKIQNDIEKYQEEIESLPSESVIREMIKGELGDSDWFYSNFMANMSNPDYIISASTNILKDSLMDLRFKSIENSERFGREFEKRIKVFGDIRDRIKKMNQDLIYVVSRIDTMTGLEHKQLHLISDIDEHVFYHLDKLTYELNKATKAKDEARKKSDVLAEAKAKIEIDKAKANIKAYKLLHFENKYKDEYYRVLKEIDKDFTDGKRTLNPKEMVDTIFDEIRTIKSGYSTTQYLQGDISQEHAERIIELWRQYSLLFSELHEDGSPKTGIDKEVQQLLLKRRENLKKFRTTKTNIFLWQRLKQNMINDFGEDSREFAEWNARNSRTVLKPEFYEHRDEIFNMIETIMKEYQVGSDNTQERIQAVWKSLFRITAPYKNEGEFTTQIIPEATLKEVKGKELEIDRLKNSIESLGMTDEDKQTLYTLFDALSDLQVRENTEQYYEDYNRELSKFCARKSAETGTTITPNQVNIDPALFNEFKSTPWYSNSHLTIQKNTYKNGNLQVDENMNPIKKDEEIPIYIYRRTVPLDSNYYEEVPSLAYTTSFVNDEWLNPNYKDEFGRPKLKKTSKYYKPSQLEGDDNAGKASYIQLERGTSEKDRVNFENIQFLMKEMQEIQKGLNTSNKLYYAIPSIEKSTWERITDEGVYNTIKGSMRNLYQNAQDYSDGLKDLGLKDRHVLANLSGEETKFIPVRYSQDIDMEDQSYDVFGSILKYQMSATKAKILEKKLAFFETLEGALSSHKVKKEGFVNVVKDKLNKSLNLGLNVSVNSTDSTRLNNIRDLINRIFYDEFKKDLVSVNNMFTFGKTLTDTKIADAINSFAGKNMMFLNIPNWIVNFFSGNLQMLIEATGNQEFNFKEDFKRAKLYLIRPETIRDIVTDAGKTHDKSLFGQMLDFFDPLQGEFENEFGEKEQWSTRRAGAKNLFFFGKNMGEWELQVSTFIAMMNAKKVFKVTNGKRVAISLMDAFEKGDKGLPKIKDGIEYEEGVPLTYEHLKDFTNKIHAINKALNGSYAKFDQSLVEKYSVARLMIFMKKFFIPLFVNRFGMKRFDLEMGTYREGHYKVFIMTFLRDLIMYRQNVIKKLGATLAAPFVKDSSLTEQYTDQQVAAIKKTMIELYMMAGFMMLLLALGYYDDDDDGDAAMFAQYILLRIGHELQTSAPPISLQETYSVLKTPYVAMGSVGNLYNLLTNIIVTPINAVGSTMGYDWFEEDLYYQKDTPLFNKGDSKVVAQFMRALGLKLNITHPKQLLKSYDYMVQIN